MSSGPSALLGAMQDAAGGSDFRFLPDPEQLDLLRDKNGKLPNDALRQMRMRRGPGRPPLARNKRTEKVAKWFIEKYGDPLAALGEIINTPVDLLYEQMILAQGGESKNKRVTGRDAMEFRKGAILDALPYVHGKQPISVDISGKADAVIFIPGLNAPAGFSAEQLTQAVETLGIAAIEQNGIRLADGQLIEDGEWSVADPAEDGEENAGGGGGQ